jgi:hypothetical protein
MRYYSGRKKLTPVQARLKEDRQRAEMWSTVLLTGFAKAVEALDGVADLDALNRSMAEHLRPALVSEAQAQEKFYASLKSRRSRKPARKAK